MCTIEKKWLNVQSPGSNLGGQQARESEVSEQKSKKWV